MKSTIQKYSNGKIKSVCKRVTCNLVPLIALLLAACGGSNPVQEEPAEHHHPETEVVELTQAQYETAGIESGQLEMRTISGSISVSGFLDTPPQSKISISAPMGGFVKNTNLLQGSYVKKGDVVVVMQHPDYIKLQQEYLESIGQLKFLKADYERQEKLAAENVSARKTFEEAESNYRTMDATVKGLRATLEMLNISMNNLEKGEIQNTVNLYSPISGYVTEINTNIGAFVNPTDVLVEIVNTASLHAELTIFEKDIPAVKIGQRVMFTLSGETTLREAEIQLIGREISDDRSIQVHCEIADADPEMIPGMFLSASIETDSGFVPSVPEEAVVFFQGKSYIFVPVEDEHAADGHNHEGEEEHQHEEESNTHAFKMLEITTGESDLGYVEITLPEGFDVKSPIVIKGAYSLLTKMKNAEGEGHVH